MRSSPTSPPPDALPALDDMDPVSTERRDPSPRRDQPAPPGPVRPAEVAEFRPPAKRNAISHAAFEFFKKSVRRIIRPALAPIEDAIAGAGGWHAWRGGLDGSLTSAIGDAHLERRLRDELAYWVRAVRVPGAHEAIDPSYGDFHAVFARWQVDRCKELAQWLGVEDIGGSIDMWQAATAALEIGGGPHPMVAQGQWRFAASVDPLNDGYAACDLFPPPPLTFTPIAAPGEQLPLTSATFDLVVCDNCLDHVADPGRVVAEIARVLKPGGHAWILVDLRSTVDDMHPHAFTPELLAAMLTSQGLQVIRERVGDHASHPLAHGEVRVLARKSIDRPG